MSQATGAVMVMMIVEITQMNRVVLRSGVQNVNSDVWMEIVSLEAGTVMGSVTAKMALTKQDAVSSFTSSQYCSSYFPSSTAAVAGRT